MNNLFYHLKIAFRNLRSGSLYSAINIGGLAVSLAVCILIFLWVRDELDFNRGFKNADRIYQIGNNVPGPLAPLIGREIPEVSHVCRVSRGLNSGVLSYVDKKFTVFDALLADSSFFTVFGIDIVRGDQQRPFSNVNSVVISESLAKDIFQDEDPIGKSINSDEYGMLNVSAVFAGISQNSSLKCRMVFPTSSPHNEMVSNWNNHLYQTYAVIAKDVDPKALSQKISLAAWKEAKPGEPYKPGGVLDFSVSPIVTQHLYAADGSPTGIKNVRLFSLVAIVLLLIAVINYVNLVTARLIKRTKEAGIRKMLGSGKAGLFLQMIRESGLMFVLSLIVATVLIFLLLPYCNNLTGKQLSVHFFSSEIWLVYLVLFLVISVLAGIYPAILMSKFKPIELAGALSLQKKSFFRKSLVVVQFTFSAGLMVMTVVLNMQLKYMRDKDPGYARENIFRVPVYRMGGHYQAIKGELLQQSAISDVTATAMPITEIGASVTRELPCKDGPREFQVMVNLGDYNILDFFEIPLVAGSLYSPDTKPNEGYVINRKMAEELGWDDVVGQMLPSFFGDGEKPIIGEVENFNFDDFHHEVKPIAILFLDWYSFFYVKTTPGKTTDAIAAVENIWKRYNDGYPLEYHFLDEEFDQIYKSDIRTGKLFNAFAVIAIFISCLGLFGLITYTAETKTKEIGIRKVLGASVASIVEMLSKEFLILVGIAMLIAFPLTYYWVDKMLQDYAYRIGITWWMFALAGIIMVALTLLTVGWKAMKAATANPVKAIKSE